MPEAGRPRSLSSRRRARDSDRGLDAETATVTKVVLSGLTLNVPRGRLLGVAGSVGSGKTSLLTAITGQVSTGQVEVLCICVRYSFGQDDSNDFRHCSFAYLWKSLVDVGIFYYSLVQSI